MATKERIFYRQKYDDRYSPMRKVTDNQKDKNQLDNRYGIKNKNNPNKSYQIWGKSGESYLAKKMSENLEFC